tara:strand:+ start:185 stop:376 length:192 start_codon:yes stop_codon:yes gene_type:complete
MNNETSYYSTSYILLADTSLVSNGAVSQKIKYFSLPSTTETMATDESTLNSMQESAISTGSTY